MHVHDIKDLQLSHHMAGNIIGGEFNLADERPSAKYSANGDFTDLVYMPWWQYLAPPTSLHCSCLATMGRSTIEGLRSEVDFTPTPWLFNNAVFWRLLVI